LVTDNGQGRWPMNKELLLCSTNEIKTKNQ
jgi:hypothetical protein